MKLGVFNFTSNNYTIQLNNTSDFANGDIIAVMGHAQYTNNDDNHHYQAVKPVEIQIHGSIHQTHIQQL